MLCSVSPVYQIKVANMDESGIERSDIWNAWRAAQKAEQEAHADHTPASASSQSSASRHATQRSRASSSNQRVVRFHNSSGSDTNMGVDIIEVADIFEQADQQSERELAVLDMLNDEKKRLSTLRS